MRSAALVADDGDDTTEKILCAGKIENHAQIRFENE